MLTTGTRLRGIYVMYLTLTYVYKLCRLRMKVYLYTYIVPYIIPTNFISTYHLPDKENLNYTRKSIWNIKNLFKLE